MTRRLQVKAKVGTRSRANMMYPSEPGYAAAMAKTSKELTDQLLSIFDQFEDASVDIMLEALEPTYELSQVYVPKDTGELSESGYLEEVSTSRGNPQVQIGYGRSGSPYYAMYVHEMTSIPHEAPTRSKFLQAAVMEDLDNIFVRLGSGYKAFLNA